jgi:hypothetical protein
VLVLFPTDVVSLDLGDWRKGAALVWDLGDDGVPGKMA